MGESFTWFPKLTRTVERVPEGQRGLLLWALVQYGTYGVELELEYPLDMAFEALRDDIDNSKNNRYRNRGGRPRKTTVTEDETIVTNCETTVSEVSETENPGFQTSEPKPDQTNTDQTKPNQSNTGQTKDGAAVRAVIDHLNAKTGKHFKASTKTSAKHIRARLNEGFTVDDLKAVIDTKTVDWLGVKASDGRDMGQYLCPETLFGSKFEKYLNQKPTGGARDEYSNL